jgi:arginine and glutamate-rich protein 1
MINESHCSCDLQAEEQLKLVEDQRKILEERQRLEDTERRRVREEQEIILNKKNARPRLSFALGKPS